jgi:hypothetical protein
VSLRPSAGSPAGIGRADQADVALVERAEGPLAVLPEVRVGATGHEEGSGTAAQISTDPAMPEAEALLKEMPDRVFWTAWQSGWPPYSAWRLLISR